MGRTPPHDGPRGERVRRWAWAILLHGALALLPAAEARAQANGCVGCHRLLSKPELLAPATQYAASVHRDPRIGCAGCHGGDASDPTVRAHAAERGFVARPAGAIAVRICAGCHSDARLIRSITTDLPVDQELLYSLSAHARAQKAGDSNAPSCADCHGSHGIVPVGDPESRVGRSRVTELCAGCHSDAPRMKSYGLPADQRRQWARSVHGQSFARGEAAPTCTGCHSPHSGNLGGASSADRACGRCHEAAKEHFEQGPHARAFAELGLARCSSCHGEHDVAPATVLLLGPAVCGRCHQGDDEPLTVAQKMRDTLSQARKRLSRIESTIRASASSPKAMAAALGELAHIERQMKAEAHALDLQKVSAHLADIERVGEPALGGPGPAVTRSSLWVPVAVLLGLFVVALVAAGVARRRALEQADER